MARPPSAALVAAEGADPLPPRSTPSVALVRVPFRGGFIEAAQFGGKVFVPLLPLCDALGVSLQGQLAKLRAKLWATIKMIFVVADDGKARQLAAVDLRSLPLWLATIEPSRVKPEARPALVAYQREAADVLYRHFAGEGPAPAAPAAARAPAPVAAPRARPALPTGPPHPWDDPLNQLVAEAMRGHAFTFVDGVTVRAALVCAPPAASLSNPVVYVRRLLAAAAWYRTQGRDVPPQDLPMLAIELMDRELVRMLPG